jgi:adenine-specific DNA-methyltransferase
MDYLKIGETREINKRYKCKLRTNWFQIPNIAEVPEGFFFKRSHGYPKLLKNEANALVTDSAYKIAMKGGYNLNSFIFSFYNSLTLLFAELEGRYYGGGVLELIPSEFNKLPIPYMDTSEQLFNEFVEKFEKKQSIKDILIENDRVLLGQNLNLDQETIVTIQNLYNRLINKRLRK